MSNFPEPRLEPPEDIEVGRCALCGGEIYRGEVCWAYEGKLLCEDHLDHDMAKLFGCTKKDGQE